MLQITRSVPVALVTAALALGAGTGSAFAGDPDSMGDEPAGGQQTEAPSIEREIPEMPKTDPETLTGDQMPQGVGGEPIGNDRDPERPDDKPKDPKPKEPVTKPAGPPVTMLLICLPGDGKGTPGLFWHIVQFDANGTAVIDTPTAMSCGSAGEIAEPNPGAVVPGWTATPHPQADP